MTTSKQRTPLTVLRGTGKSQLQHAFDGFLLDCQTRLLSPLTTKFYRRHLGQFLEYSAKQGVTDLAGIFPTHIRAYLVGLQERRMADNAQHGAARSLRACLNFCINEGRPG